MPARTRARESERWILRTERTARPEEVRARVRGGWPLARVSGTHVCVCVRRARVYAARAHTPGPGRSRRCVRTRVSVFARACWGASRPCRGAWGTGVGLSLLPSASFLNYRAYGRSARVCMCVGRTYPCVRGYGKPQSLFWTTLTSLRSPGAVALEFAPAFPRFVSELDSSGRKFRTERCSSFISAIYDEMQLGMI